jgi:hypothetical protein
MKESSKNKLMVIGIAMMICTAFSFCLFQGTLPAKADIGNQNNFFEGTYNYTISDPRSVEWDSINYSSLTVPPGTTIGTLAAYHLYSLYYYQEGTVSFYATFDWYYQGNHISHYVVGTNALDVHEATYSFGQLEGIDVITNYTGFGMTQGNGQYELMVTFFVSANYGLSSNVSMSMFFNTTTPFAVISAPSIAIDQIGGIMGGLFIILGPLAGVFIMRTDTKQPVYGIAALLLFPLIGLYMVYVFILT